jgi:putative aldouronate transport system permease protein
MPMTGLVVAFKDYSFRKGILGSPWAAQHGLQYFLDFFNYYDCLPLIRNTLVSGFIKAIAAFPFPIVFALLLNEIRSKRFKMSVQTISYLPYFISWVIVSLLTFRVLAPDDGLLNMVAKLFGGDGSTYYLMEAGCFYPILLITYLWKNIGWNSIIYLAAMASIDPELYEAASIDGAKKLRKIWHITLAGIKPTMGVLFILAVGQIVMAMGFEQNYLLRTPGNMKYADILDIFVMKQGFEQGNYSYATAIGLLQSITALIFVTVSNKLSNKYLEVGIW